MRGHSLLVVLASTSLVASCGGLSLIRNPTNSMYHPPIPCGNQSPIGNIVEDHLTHLWRVAWVPTCSPRGSVRKYHPVLSGSNQCMRPNLSRTILASTGGIGGGITESSDSSDPSERLTVREILREWDEVSLLTLENLQKLLAMVCLELHHRPCFDPLQWFSCFTV